MDEKLIDSKEAEESISLAELFGSLKRNILLLLVIVIFVLGLGVVYTWFVVDPMYSSSVDLQISNVNESVATVNQIKSNVKEIVKYSEIIEVVVVDLNLGSTDTASIEAKAKDIAKRVSSGDIGSSSAVKVSYQDKDPVLATKIVIAIAEETARRVNIPKDDIDSGSLAFSEETLVLLNRPRENPNQSPSSPNKVLNLTISLVLGMIVAVVVVIMKEQFSSYFKSKREVERITNYSVIAMIPARKGVKKGE